MAVAPPNKNHARIQARTTRLPLWKGPNSPDPQGGITNSLLCKFLVCRERFRLKVVEGLSEDEGFNKALEFGQMWHEMEEAYHGCQPDHQGEMARSERMEDANKALAKYRIQLCARYQNDQAEINKWAALCKMQFPLYLKHWAKHNDDKTRQPILEEVSFCVPYTLPSGRTVYLRGKFDNVHLCDRPDKRAEPDLYRAWMEHFPKATQGIFLQENKTKGDIDQDGILHTVAQNLQTMIYQTALRISYDTTEGELHRLNGGKVYHKNITKDVPIVGTLYNVIRRPLADRFAIKQRKGRKSKGKVTGAESQTQFLNRVIYGEDGEGGVASDPGHYFMRWKTIITPDDRITFGQRILNPILEQVCNWWEWLQASPGPFDPWSERPNWPNPDCGTVIDAPACALTSNRIHWQAPWGVYNSMFGGYRGDFYELLSQGRKNNLSRISTLFPELA